MKKTLMIAGLMGFAGLSGFPLTQAFAGPIAGILQPMRTEACGEILALESGLALYTFDMDTPPTSNCHGKCAEIWPPVSLNPEETAVAQQSGPHFSTSTRENGLVQMTFDGKPVYTFHFDRVNGDCKGNGVGGVWHVIPANIN